MTDAQHKKLVIDLAACDSCYGSEGSCAVNCGGLLGLREQATFALICRRCEHASCIIACPFDALERTEDGGIIKRHNLRCVSCKLCAQACPFGTIYTELLPFYETLCNGCAGREEKSCVAGCRQGAIEYRLVEPDEEGVHIVDDYLAARSDRWIKREPGAEVAA
jgi:Fe-S-cluster-containing hydrogenase component 2